VRSRLALVAVAAVLTVAVVALGLHYLDPFPPRRIVLATGQAGGTYEAVGREYQRRLGREGLRVELLSSAGSIENLQRLLGGQADVAFVQAEPTRSCRTRKGACGAWPRCTGSRSGSSTGASR
jgi:TRAP-type uncharacterized transport system substrate-binding protein